MTGVQTYARAITAVAHRDLLMYLSYRSRLISHALSIVVSFTMFFYISKLIRLQAFGNPRDYFGFVIIGLIIVAVLQAALGVATALRSELLAGTFERFVCSSFGAVNGIASMVVFPILLELGFAIFGLVLGATVFDVPVKWSTAALALPVAILGALVFASIGLIFSGAVLIFKQTSSAVTYIATLMGLLGGIYFPVALLPGWAEWIANLQPLTPSVDLLRHLLIGLPLKESAWTELLKIVGFLIFLSPFTYALLLYAVRFSRRRATLLEY